MLHSLNGKYRVLNSDGNKITELIYDDIKFLETYQGLIVTLKGKMGMMDNSGKPSSITMQKITPSENK